MKTPLAWLVSFALIVLCVGLGQGEPSKNLRSKDFEIRKQAVAALVASPDKKTERLLIGALDDSDGEIVELAAQGLGTLGPELAGKSSVKALRKLALEAPVRRLRLSAAQALAALDPLAAQSALAKKLNGDYASAAAEALIVIARTGGAEAAQASSKALAKVVDKSKDYTARVVAARALLFVSGDERAGTYADLLEHPALGVRAATLEAASETAVPADLEPVGALLLSGRLTDVIERRALDAACAALWVHADGSRADATTALVNELAASSVASVARCAPRLVERLAAPPSPASVPGADRGYELDLLVTLAEPALESGDPGVRAAAAQAFGTLAGVGHQGALERLRVCAAEDPDARVRRTALAGSVVERDEASVDWLAARLGAESDARTREDLAVALGFKDNARALSALVTALDDEDVWVRVCAAVSIGKTRLEQGVQPLAAQLASEDWRVRGACVIGLGALYQKAAIPALIGMVEDPEPVVARSAQGFLEVFSKSADIEPTIAGWEGWWREREERTTLVDPETAEERAEKYGYTKNWERIYGGLDVVVLESRGDHIQNVLQKLAIQHRLTHAAAVADDAVRPASVFVANCTGEIEEPDVERLAWFVRSGGYLFGSCWALTHTIERVYPGVLKQQMTKGEVLDTVGAVPCAGDSPYLSGVFEPGAEPLYSLVGAHLIAVVDAERAEVLIDSPECAERWGEGNLAAWFPVGHGVVLDSVNHFEEQGLLNAQGLKTPEDRQAYALNHMGLSWEELRATREDDFWTSNAKAAREIIDLSVFRLVTNFVRAKRVGG